MTALVVKWTEQKAACHVRVDSSLALCAEENSFPGWEAWVEWGLDLWITVSANELPSTQITTMISGVLQRS